jgi:hypothetical protein
MAAVAVALVGGMLAVPASAKTETRSAASVQKAASTGPIYQLINKQTNMCLNRYVNPTPCSEVAETRWWWNSTKKLWVHEKTGRCLTAFKDSTNPQVLPCDRLPILNHVELGGGMAMIRWPIDDTCLDANAVAAYVSKCWKEDIGQHWIRKVVG